MNEKRKWPWQEAMDLAEQLKADLNPFCERIEIAGSLRRRKPLVGDIELLFIPRYEDRKVDFFATEPVSTADEELARWLKAGVIEKRLSVVGVATWGTENKLARHIATGIPVDFFTTDELRWWTALVVRTGSQANNEMLASSAIANGRRFHARGSGISQNGKTHTAYSEEDVFRLCGVKYLEPEKR